MWASPITTKAARSVNLFAVAPTGNGNPGDAIATEEAAGRLRGSDFAKTDRQPALIAGCCVLLDDAPFGGAIDQRISLGDQFGGAFDILGFEQAPHRTDAMAQAGLASTVNRRTVFGHAHAFQRRYSICHSILNNTAVCGGGSNPGAGGTSGFRAPQHP